MRFPFGKSRLRKAIERGLQNGKLREELMELDDLVLKSTADADDVVWGLEQLKIGRANIERDVFALTRLFQEVDEEKGEDAFERLQQRGIPELLRLYDAVYRLPSTDATELLFVLKILAIYGTVEGTLKVIEAAREPLAPESYMWTPILTAYAQQHHPERELLFGALKEELPPKFIAVSLIDVANTVAREDESFSHPFDTPRGKAKLREWLTSRKAEEYSYGHSATAALPFISGPEQEDLLKLAMEHPDVGVRMEAAWAAVKTGKNEAVDFLARQCLDYKTAEGAKQYLTELGREDAIPPQAKDATFNALSQFALWLAHPNELGRAPDELQVVDHRELKWPPDWEATPFWLIKYKVYNTTGLDEDDEGCGLVGSMTFCLFTYDLDQRPPEDGYGIHCYWELSQHGLIDDSDVSRDENEYAHLLQEWTGPKLENARMLQVAELSPELKYPQRLIGLASASLNGEEGWVVLDGNRSKWYPRAEQPAECYEKVVLELHVGREMLGLTEKSDRKKYLRPPAQPKTAEQVICGYEKILNEARQAPSEEERKKKLDGFGAIESHFDRYLDALREAGRCHEICDLISFIAPYWDHALGYAKLGNAALKHGYVDLAEQFLVKYRSGCGNFAHGEEMAALAEIWQGKGKRQEAMDLLITCMEKLLEESKTATDSDIDLFEEWFQGKRAALLKLFGDDGERLLQERRIPKSTLKEANRG